MDLNADVGEGDGRASTDDAALMRHITSASIACGFHAGDPAAMRRTIVLAREHGVAIGAHPSFADRDGFGRRELVLPPAEIESLVLYQVGALAAIAVAEGVRLQHVKPHGALYSLAARDRGVAEAIASATRAADPSLILFGMAGSELIAAGRRAGLRTAAEGFADRAYRPDGSLVPRSEPGAVIDDPDVVAARAVTLARQQTPRVDTLCVHSDTPGAAALAARIRRALEDAAVRVAALGSER